MTIIDIKPIVMKYDLFYKSGSWEKTIRETIKIGISKVLVIFCDGKVMFDQPGCKFSSKVR